MGVWIARPGFVRLILPIIVALSPILLNILKSERHGASLARDKNNSNI